MKNAIPLWSRVTWLVLVLVLSGTVGGCARSKTTSEVAPKTVADFFDVRVGAKVLRLQIAVRDEEMQRGLMERRDLAENDGMLFVYSRPQPMSFWMRDTPTPLDIGFFNTAGVLEEIYPMHPYDETPIKSRNDRLHFALETNQGWYHRNGIRPGARLDVDAVLAALKARGFPSENLGLRK